MTAYITSDPHPGHKNIIEYTGRPYSDIDEMWVEFVKNFSHLTDDDLLIVVGDAAMGKRDETLTFFDEIAGTKILVMGNHDHCHPMFSQGKREKWHPIYAQFFDMIVQEMMLQIGRHLVKVNHFPYEGDHSEDRYNAEKIDKWRPRDDGHWLLHGHVHSEEIFWGEQRSIHVGIDADWTDYGIPRYSPIPLSVIESVIETHDYAEDLLWSTIGNEE